MEELSRTTVTDEVYNLLKNKILNLDYKPGRALSAVKITKEMNVSRSPAREALIKLQSDNLVEIIPQVGTKVSLINIDKLNEERFLRTSLENSALTRFTYDHSNEQIEKMEELILKQEQALLSQNFIKLLDYDNRFHEIVFLSIRKPDCWKLLTNYNSNEYRLRLLALLALKETTQYVINSHESLLKFIKERNEKKVIECSNLHFSKMNEEIPKLLSIYPEIFEYNETKNKIQNTRINKDENNFMDSVLKNKSYL